MTPWEVREAASLTIDDIIGMAADPGDEVERPVLMTGTQVYVVWTEQSAKDVDQDGANYELLTDAPVDAWIEAEEVEDWRWLDIYSQPFGPWNACMQGPAWRCMGDHCLGYQGPGDSNKRNHSPRCSIAGERRDEVAGAVKDPKPCIDYERCRRPRVWRVTSPADLFHSDPVNADRALASAHTCDAHLSETVEWARGVAGTVEIVPLGAGGQS